MTKKFDGRATSSAFLPFKVSRSASNWCAQQGLDVNSDAANYGFLKHELETSIKDTIASLKQAQTVSDAVTVFLKEYEKAGAEATDKRVAWANLALDAFRSAVVA